MKFLKEATEDEIYLVKRGRRSSVSQPILTEFLESGMKIAKVDLEAIQEPKSIVPTLTNYVKSHGLPVKVVTRKGNVYLVRLEEE